MVKKINTSNFKNISKDINKNKKRSIKSKDQSVKALSAMLRFRGKGK